MMKKYILTLMILLLAGANAAWGQNVVKIGDTGYATLQAAIDDVTTGDATTIEFISSNTAVSGDGFQIPDGTSDRNITINFNGCTYTVTGGAVGSSGTINQCMHFASGNTLTLKNGTINVQENLSSIRIMMQNYCNLTLDNFNVDCSNVITQTYTGTSYGDWNGRTRPVFNFNAGTSTITNSTITFNNTDQFGVLIDKEGSAGNLTIGEGTTINGNVTALGGIATINNAATINGNVLVDKVEANQATGTITINGGTINGSAQSKNGVSSLIFPGGSTAAFPNAVAKVLNTSNTARCYTTNFEDAFATVQEGETIELLKDAALTGDVTLNKSFNLDFKDYAINLNGHTIKLGQDVTIKTNKLTSIFTAVYDNYIVTWENSGDTYFKYAYKALNSINIADGKLLVTSNAIYTGETQVPSTTTITVKYDGVELNAEHYDITYASNDLSGTTENGYKDAQTYSRAITISAKGTTYYGSVTADYVIAPRNMNQVMATEVKEMAWTGDILTPIINGNDATTNNINLTYGNYKLVANGTKMDYTYTSDPTPIKDPGTYTITFEGRGNFTGTKQLTVHVLKGIDNVILAENIYIVPNSNSPITASNIVVKDGANTLVQGPDPDYTIKIYTDADCTIEVPSITTETLKDSSNEDVAGLILYVKLSGNDGNSYNNTKIIPIYTVREYLPKALNSTATPIDFHATGLSSTANTVNVALGNSQGNNVIATTTTSLTVPATANVTLNNKAGDATTAQEITLKVTDIENNAFTGCTHLRWIDGTVLPASFTPSSLERSVSGTTFFGVPKQALVYLPGTTFVGENYVYSPGDGNYYCEKFKIYDDLSGSQTSFSETDGYKWAYENIHEFTAYTIENTRALTAGRHYTTCLPYDLPLPATLKAYTLKGTNTANTLIGFEEVTGTLTKYMPYVLIPSTSGQLLSTTNAVVQKLEESSEKTALGPASAGNFTMYGTMRYMDGTDADGKYIMQYNNGSPTWKVISGSSSYNGACILPMRAYISGSGASGARTYLNATFTDAEGNTTNIEKLRVDEEDGTIYDLQGRKQISPTQKGIYIIPNGRKMIVK